jgi:hypothetical protein
MSQTLARVARVWSVSRVSVYASNAWVSKLRRPSCESPGQRRRGPDIEGGTFDTIEELRAALVEFAMHYNEIWQLDQNAMADVSKPGCSTHLPDYRAGLKNLLGDKWSSCLPSILEQPAEARAPLCLVQLFSS